MEPHLTSYMSRSLILFLIMYLVAIRVVSNADNAKITQIINQLCLMFTSPSSALHARNGGLIGLAATAIALGQKFAQWLSVVIPRVLGCFADPESRVRYYACESLYNIAKVCKGEILVHFNGIFDALSKVSHPSPTLVGYTDSCSDAIIALGRLGSLGQERRGTAGSFAKGYRGGDRSQLRVQVSRECGPHVQ